MWFRNRHGEPREAQLLVALAACSGCPLTRLELHGAVPLSEVVAEVVHACCPQLASMCLEHRRDRQELRRSRVDSRPQLQASEAYTQGVLLFHLCGPQLRELRLWHLNGWRTVPYEALLFCTALTSLHLDDGWSSDFSIGLRPASSTVEADVMEVVSQLRTLRSLHLCIKPPRSCHTPDAVATNATCVGRLSALTAPTHLHLVLPDCYTHHGYSWEKQQEEGDQHAALCKAREAHRTSLLSALRAMPQLQHLHCRTLWLQPNELPYLSCLITSLTVAGLLPPAADRTRPHGCYLGNMGVGLIAVLPQLRKLELLTGASPRALSALYPLPRSLARAVVPLVRFGTSDVDEEGRLTAEAVAAVFLAVCVLLSCSAPYSTDIVAESGPERLLPRAGSLNGYMEWIRQLQGLDACSSLKLRNVALRTGDMCCLAKTLPGIDCLDLGACSFPVAAFPGLRPVMRELRRLYVDFDHEGLGSEELVSVLVMLCRPHAWAVPLTSLECGGLPLSVDPPTVEEAVLQQLESDFGGMDVDICLWHDCFE